MAQAFLIYGPRGAGKTTTTLKLADELAKRGVLVGGYYQRTVVELNERRGYDLVRFGDSTQTLALAREGCVSEGPNTVCSFSFSSEAFATGEAWLREDAQRCAVLVLDEISKLEVRGEGNAQALRWALGLEDDIVLLLSVRADQLFYVVEAFDLESRVVGYLEIPSTDDEVALQADQLRKGLNIVLG